MIIVVEQLLGTPKNIYEPAFPNAKFGAIKRIGNGLLTQITEKASFLKENIHPIKESGQLEFISKNANQFDLPFSEILFVDGHTDSMMIPHIQYKGKTIVFMADLLPSIGHIPLPYVMGYDTRPLTLSEKQSF